MDVMKIIKKFIKFSLVFERKYLIKKKGVITQLYKLDIPAKNKKKGFRYLKKLFWLFFKYNITKVIIPK